MMKKSVVCTLCLLAGLWQLSHAQRIRNVVAEFEDDDRIKISYDLIGELAGQIYQVQLYSSLDNFSQPLSYVTGDLGGRVETGEGKSIYWDAGQELVSFEGSLTFEVKASLVSSPLSLISPDKDLSIKRGERLPIRWLGVMPNGNVHLDLYQGVNRVGSIGSVKNSGAYNWNIPTRTKPGSDYWIKLNSSNSTQSDASQRFKIKRRIPLAFKIIPIAAIVPAVILLTQEGGPLGGDVPTILPKPPDKPD